MKNLTATNIKSVSKVLSMKTNQELCDSEANIKFQSIVENENHSIRFHEDDSYMMLSESGLYEFMEEWDDNTVIYLKKIL